MVISFEGPMGEGKTSSATAIMAWYAANEERKIISNTPLSREYFPNYQELDMEYFLKHMGTKDVEMTDCIILLDEFYQLADSRSSGSKENKIFSYFVVQTRKRNVDLYFCTHNLDHLDLRVRRAVDIRGSCRFDQELPCRKCKGTGEYHGKLCDRCLGFIEPSSKQTHCGLQRVVFSKRRRKMGMKRSIEISFWGPTQWHLFDTYKRLPIAAKAFEGIETEMY